jgi:hypothetical protein
VLVGVDLQALDDLGLQLAFLAAGDLDGVQQGQHADRPSGRLGRADPGCWGGLQAAERLTPTGQPTRLGVLDLREERLRGVEAK